uniref:GAG-pre-integrase domain-containing protein n=1 Tax=Daphnia galeata TaxID=27404 RepID=A0A8J2RTS1_9CRUS|nr:unnamed protein product [Daphnia galeata]
MSSLCLAARTNSDWFADSGATVHMCSQRWMFKTFVAIKPGSQSIGGIKGVNVKVLGEGSIDFVTQLNGVNHLSTFQHVLFAPDLGINLFSIAAVRIMAGSRVGLSLYHLNISVPRKDENVAVLALPFKNTYTDWHSRLGHISNDIIKKMAANGVVNGLTLAKDAELPTSPCHGWHPWKNEENYSITNLENIEGMDLKMPMDLTDPWICDAMI